MASLKNNQTVYSGPDAKGYLPVESLNAETFVTALWAENKWAYIEYKAVGADTLSRGYVPAASLKSAGSLPQLNVQKERKFITGNGSTYSGPGLSGYKVLDYLSAGEAVTTIGKKENNLILIEYPVSKTSQMRRGYISSDILGSIPPNGLIENKRPPGMNLEKGKGYRTNINMFYSAGLAGQCTWYCWGRAYEKCGRSLVIKYPNSGKYWYKNYVSGGAGIMDGSSPPVANAIASFSGGKFGHVVFIEDVCGSTIYYTEANANSDGVVSPDDGIVKITTLSNFKTLGRKTLNGYILL